MAGVHAAVAQGARLDAVSGSGSRVLAAPLTITEVQPHARGHGVGTALLVHLAKLAVARGAGRFDWNVLDWNEPAIGFYQRLGATVLPDWRTCRLTGEKLQALAATTP